MESSFKPNPVDQLLAAFGGLTKTARALGHRHVTTVQSWRKRGRVPAWRLPEIRVAADRAGVRLPEWASPGSASESQPVPEDAPPDTRATAAA
jgi:hypothetical protein